MACASSLDLPHSPVLPTKPSKPKRSLLSVAAAAHIDGHDALAVNSAAAHIDAVPKVNGQAKPKVNGAAQRLLDGCSRVGISWPHIDGRGAPVSGAGLRVAFQGAPGAYSEFAAKTALPGCSTVPCRAFADAIAAVNGGGADRAILPVESTMEGTELRNYDLLLRHDLRIVQEISLFVHYCLLAMPGVRAAELRRVISHPMALAHCGRALTMLGVDREPVEDTAGAVEMLRSSRLLDTAAIASPRAADLYGLDVLAHGLQDESWNVTRFLILAKPSSAPPPAKNSNAKTSMVIAHRGGSMVVLLKVLSAFSSRNLNLTKLEVINNAGGGEGRAPVMILDTRGRGVPTMRAFPHVLYVDCEGAADEPRLREAVEEVEKHAVFVRVLGCYAADSNVYDLQ